MKESLKKLLKKADWEQILIYLESLSTEERFTALNFLMKVDLQNDLLDGDNGFKLIGAQREAFYNNRQKISSCLDIAKLACVSTEVELKKASIAFKIHKSNWLSSCLAFPDLGSKPLMLLFSKYPPKNLDSLIREISKERFARIDFKLLWEMHTHSWVSFNEELFVNSLFVVHMFYRNTVEDAQFLIENPEAFNKVFLQFYKYELPVLDISKWQGRDDYHCAKVTTYWAEVLDILLEKKIDIPRDLIGKLLNSLLNNWKKPHLNWHISLIEKLQPTTEEYIAQQQLFFSFFNSDNLKILNFLVGILKEIQTEKEFDHEAFIANVPSLFIREKVDKTLTKLLPLVIFSLEEHTNLQENIGTQLSLGLVQKNTQTQAKFARLIVQYSPKEELADLVAPYISVLKIKALGILEVKKEEEIELKEENLAVEFVKVPETWDDLLFCIGKCLSSKLASDIDLFLHGLVILQDSIPEDYQKQLKPYHKQLNKRHWEEESILCLNEFIENWYAGNKIYSEIKSLKNTSIPFLRHKCKLVFLKLQKKDTLPLLSTPTQLPFYIDPTILVDRLLTYQQLEKEVDFEDLLVATNRIVKEKADAATIKKAKLIKGKYGKAIRYLIGITDVVTIEPDILPLWTQICRTKHPNKEFKEFKTSLAKEIPTVIKPFYTNFTIKKDSSENWSWYRLSLEENWNKHHWYIDKEDKPKVYSELYYYTSPNGLAFRTDIFYQISLLPHYIDAWLCRYMPDTASDNEVAEQEQCRYPLQAILDYKLKVYHSGWHYIAQCLVFQKKESREMAAEYILFAIKNNCINSAVLAKSLGVMMAKKFAPVKRLTDYIEKPGHSKAVKEVQLKICSSCIIEVEEGKLPNSFKKIVVFHSELLQELKREATAEIIDKIKVLKK